MSKHLVEVPSIAIAVIVVIVVAVVIVAAVVIVVVVVMEKKFKIQSTIHTQYMKLGRIAIMKI